MPEVLPNGNRLYSWPELAEMMEEWDHRFGPGVPYPAGPIEMEIGLRFERETD